jgi:aminoglycoside phosphotransferase (APT) family kinase protein
VSALAELRRDIDRALERGGMTPRQVVLISPLGERKGIRLAYQVELDDGRTVKARHFGSEAAARRVFELQARLEVAFARVVAQEGAVLIEEWIEGTTLSDLQAEAWAEEAGALLGRLHCTPLGARGPQTARTRNWREAAESDLALIAGAGKLSAGDVVSLQAEMARRDPGAARVVLLNKDFCAENMLIDGQGRLRIIDNEQLDIAPAGFDLGRTFHRWPMADATWTRFLRAYRSCAPAAPEALGFWKIVASLETTRVFLQRFPVRLDASLTLLRRFAVGLSLGDPA